MSADRKEMENLHELAPLYAVGGLSAEESAGFERHLRECAECTAEVRRYQEVAAVVGESVPVTPRPELKKKLMERVREASRRPGVLLQQKGILVERPEELPWKKMAPGIEVKLLYRDEARKYNTCMVRMAPGAHYPPHRHTDVEELFLLTGDLHLGDDVMYAGDYCRAESDSIHGDVYTTGGCTYIAMASSRDEFVEA